MNNLCKIVEDLLPLYVEGLVNEENMKLIDEHLLACDKCKKLFNEMKTDFINESPVIPSLPLEDKALTIAKVLSKYHNILKLSLCTVMILFAVVACSLPINFINTLGLLVLIPFICRLIYGKTMPLVLVSSIGGIIGGIMVAGSILDGWTISLGQLLLMSIGVFSASLFVKARALKGNKSKMITAATFSLILLVLGLFINSGFCGTPIAYIKSYNKLSAYINKTYPEKDMKIKGIFYDWYDGGYSGKISKGSETFTIYLRKNGYIENNYTINQANTYYDSYADMLQIALNAKFKDQYFWVVAGSKKDDNISFGQLVPPKDMDLIIRFTTSNDKTPQLKVISQNNFIQLSKDVVKELDNLKLPYNNINFQALDEDKIEMYLDLDKGFNADNIFKSQK